jgi:hypothetical protein
LEGKQAANPNKENTMATSIKRFIPSDLQGNYKVARYVKCQLCSKHVDPSAASNEKFCGKVVTVCNICSGVSK